MIVRSALVSSALLFAAPVLADQVTITGGSVYVTKSDCAQLAEHRPAPDVAYQPGVDVHGKPVAPADVPGSQDLGIGSNRAVFNVVVNPMTFAQSNAAQGQTSGTSAQKYANTQLPVAHVEVDLKTGETSVNGHPLTSQQDKIVREACRKAGYR